MAPALYTAIQAFSLSLHIRYAESTTPSQSANVTMLRINWFEVLLPSDTLEVYCDTFSSLNVAPPPIREIDSRTTVRFEEDGIRVCYLTYDNLSKDTTNIVLNNDPHVFNHVIETGFSSYLMQKTFVVYTSHVGARAFIDSSDSPQPDIFTYRNGISYRSFFFRKSERIHIGFVMKFVKSHRFTSNLEDTSLAEFSINRRVVPHNKPDVLVDNDGDALNLSSAILRDVGEKYVVIEGSKGDIFRSARSDWSLECNRHNLLEYTRELRDDKTTHNLSRDLQIKSLTLTSNGRMNTSLAKDQLQALLSLLNTHDLLSFALPTIGHNTARILKEPLSVN